jgi:subtilase-type serine protease
MISQRLGALRSGQAEPGLANPPLAYAPSLAANPAVAMLMRLPASAPASNNAWVRGYGFGGRLGGDANAGGASYRGGGMIGGFDRQITPSFLAGLSLGYSSTDTDFRRFSGKGSIDTYEGALYGSYTSGKLRLDGLVGYGRLNLESQRSIAFGGLSRRAKAKYDGDRFTGALEAGYAIDLGWSTIEPLLALRYTFLRQDGFSETGADSIGLNVAGQSASSLLGSVGLRLAREFELGEGRFAIEARGRWQRELLDDTVAVDAAFIGAPAATFAVDSAKTARDSAILGIGLSARAGRTLTLFADYDVRLNRDDAAHALTAGLRASW